jgi:hypothetical protein
VAIDLTILKLKTSTSFVPDSRKKVNTAEQTKYRKTIEVRNSNCGAFQISNNYVNSNFLTV